jgi:uncharacterized protein YcaQ
MERLSLRAARRIALAAQGFADARPKTSPDPRHFRRVVGRLGLLQLDSVQAVCRSHFLPLYSRLGTYDRDRLDAWISHSGEVFETWSHEASVVPVDLEPLLRHRRERAARGETGSGLRRFAQERAKYVESVYAEVRDRGPLAAGELSDPRRRVGTWWNGRSDGKRALEWLFRIGRVGSRRSSNFTKLYDLFERVVPERVRALDAPDERDAVRQLLEVAARCHGIGTAADLGDYFRNRMPLVRPALAELVEDGRLEEVAVEGWRESAFLHPGAKRARKLEARALLSPFDPVVWFRPRGERLFDFRYRIEIYVPESKREFGYYVLPFLLGDRLVGRVDLKADRAGDTLRAKGCFAEAWLADDPRALAAAGEALAAELRRLADFLGLSDVSVTHRGELARVTKPHL